MHVLCGTLADKLLSLLHMSHSKNKVGHINLSGLSWYTHHLSNDNSHNPVGT